MSNSVSIMIDTSRSSITGNGAGDSGRAQGVPLGRSRVRFEAEPRIACYIPTLQAGAESPLTSPALGRAGFNRVETDEGEPLLRVAAYSTNGRIDSTW